MVDIYVTFERLPFTHHYVLIMAILQIYFKVNDTLCAVTTWQSEVYI